MKTLKYCIRCEMEGKKVKGTIKVSENTVSGEAYMCEEHYNEWLALQELLKEEYGNSSPESIYD